MTTEIPSSILNQDNVKANLPNIIINGGMEIWQRGTSFVSPPTLTNVADKWEFGFSGSPVPTVSREASVISTGKYALKIATTVASGTGVYVLNYIENYESYKGKTVTLSARVNASVASRVRIKLYDGVTIANSSYHSGGSAYETLTVSLTISASATTLLAQIGIFGDSVPITSFYADDVMLVVGDQSVAYVTEDPQQEVARCKRYYEKIIINQTYLPIASYGGAGVNLVYNDFSMNTKSAVPSLTANTSAVSLTGTPTGTGSNTNDIANWVWTGTTTINDSSFRLTGNRNAVQTTADLLGVISIVTAEV